jgi:hypothetical protein
MQMLHDEQCKDGGVASQPELHLQQTGPLFGPEPYKHPKITKLNRNTPWIKYNKKQGAALQSGSSSARISTQF